MAQASLYLASDNAAWVTGIVLDVKRDTLTAIVEIQAGPHRIVSLMTREGADELGLEVGDLAVAAVKATTVIIEVPPVG